MSAHKRTEESRQQKSFYETLLKAQSDLGEGLIVVEDERFVYCNEAFCEITGYRMTELTALPNVLNLAVPEERGELEDRLNRRLSGEAVEEHYETTLRHASGRRVELEVAARLLRRPNHSPQIVAIVRDVTRRKQAENQSESIMSALLALHEASRVLNSTLELAEIGERLLEVVRRVFSFDAAILHVLTQDGELRTLRAFGPEDLRHAVSARAARQAALHSKERQLFRTVRSDERSYPWVGVCIPLQVREHTIGVLEGYSLSRNLSDGMIETLESMGCQAARAIENARLYQEVADREAQLEGLIGKLLEVQEQERRRVAHEVHDGLTQVAISTHQSLQAFADDFAPATATGHARLNRILQLAYQTVREARHVIIDLRPIALDDFGLAVALRLKVERLRSDGWDIGYDETLGDKRLPPDIETALFRVAQEALTNVCKHAFTSRACVVLTRQDTKVRLEVSDAGCGFDQHETLERTEQGEHVGLSIIQEKIALLRGRCRIHSGRGVGTSVVVEVPLPKDEGEGTEHAG